MKKLALKRQRKHQSLIEKLRKKVNAIKENKDRLGGKVDYETNLLIMEDFNMDDSNYSEQDDEEGKVFGSHSRDDMPQNDDGNGDDTKKADD